MLPTAALGAPQKQYLDVPLSSSVAWAVCHSIVQALQLVCVRASRPGPLVPLRVSSDRCMTCSSWAVIDLTDLRVANTAMVSWSTHIPLVFPPVNAMGLSCGERSCWAAGRRLKVLIA